MKKKKMNIDIQLDNAMDALGDELAERAKIIKDINVLLNRYCDMYLLRLIHAFISRMVEG